jgi:hypothetical protein
LAAAGTNFYASKAKAMKKLLTILLLLCCLHSYADPTERQKRRIERRIKHGTNPNAKANRKAAKILMIVGLVVIIKLGSIHD